MSVACVTLCDPGLISLASHNFNYAEQILAALAGQGFAVRLYAFAKARPVVTDRLGAVPHFTSSLFGAQDLADPVSARAQLDRMNQLFAADMGRLPVDAVGADTLLLLPAITQHQIEGLADWLLALPVARRPRVVVQLMFAPGWHPVAASCPCGEAAYVRALARLAPLCGRWLFLCAETEAVAQVYRRLGAPDVSLLSIPTPAMDIVRRPAAPDGRSRLAMLGFSKREKGFHLLPRLMRACAARGVTAHWLVQALHFGDDVDISDISAGLVGREDVHLVTGAVEQGHLAHLITAASAVVLPYDPASYAGRGSSLFSECVALGTPCVVSAGTAMAVAASAGQAVAESFAYPDVEDCADAIARLLAGDAASRAAALAGQWRARHSPEQYVRTILELIGIRWAWVSPSRPTPRPVKSLNDLHAYPPLALNQPQSLRLGMDLLCDGWGAHEDAGVVLVADEASVAVLAQGAAPGGRLVLTLAALEPGALTVICNGQRVGETAFQAGAGRVSLALPVGAWGHDLPVVLRLRTEAGQGLRVLSLAVETIS
ncbi:hypothetical protein [Magnetospirillum sp. 64-120]|uniref:hypothetical protein n=1 Tax=Magnetospirillum sp. 64-120 TaxID=1895778 RepID=UPI0025C0E7EF|nr:hypothetical protein [Magnetospirillum sp. 64-120]